MTDARPIFQAPIAARETMIEDMTEPCTLCRCPRTAARETCIYRLTRLTAVDTECPLRPRRPASWTTTQSPGSSLPGGVFCPKTCATVARFCLLTARSDQTISYYRPRARPGTLWPAPHTTAAPSFSSADPAQLKCLFTQPFSRHAYPVYLHDRHVEQLQYYGVCGTAHVSQLLRRLVAVSLRVFALLLLRASVGRLSTQPPECPETFPGVYERPHGSVHDLDASRPR